jgi:hypothetical protein
VAVTVDVDVDDSVHVPGRVEEIPRLLSKLLKMVCVNIRDKFTPIVPLVRVSCPIVNSVIHVTRPCWSTLVYFGDCVHLLPSPTLEHLPIEIMKLDCWLWEICFTMMCRVRHVKESYVPEFPTSSLNVGLD